MTRNLYIGTDLGPVFSAPSLPALLDAVGAGWAQVLANDFPARAEAIAGEIEAARPDVVGLQEAVLYRRTRSSGGRDAPGETAALDFLGVLQDALNDRGLAYDAVATFTGTDAQLPAGLRPAFDLRLTDRVVVLARTNAKTAELKWSNPQSRALPTTLTVATVAGPFALRRGWASVDLEIRGRQLRFVTTHLEAFATPERDAQAAELLAGPAATGLPVVLAGDLNSGPGSDLGAYGILLGGGFNDAWQSGQGFTCCHPVDLRLPDPTLTARVDLVLTRGGFETAAIRVVGTEPADRTASGLWPSDHAGLVATLRLPEGGS